MRKKVFSFMLAAAMALAVPTAAFASDTLVNPDGTPVSNDIFDDGWTKATPTDVIELAAAEAYAVIDPYTIVEEEYGDGEELVGVSVSSSSIGGNRLSSTSGNVTAYAAFNTTATQSSCNIYLQEQYNGSWRTATGVPTTAYTKYAYNSNSITAGKTFTLVSGKVYRAKIVFSDTNSAGTYYQTRYTGSF